MDKITNPPTMSLPPPPPPLPQLQPLPPLSVSGAEQRMRKMNWKKLTSHNLPKDCFWVNQQNFHMKKSLVDQLTQHFSLPNNNIVIGSAEISRLRVLNSNGAKNLMISLHVLFKNASHEEIKGHILHCDTSTLSSIFVESLIKCLPHPDKIKELHKMSKDDTKLLDVEKFVASLGDIERLEARLHSISFKLSYNDMVEGLEPNIMAGTAACEGIISSIKFGRILTLILSIGNTMNSGSTMSGATGFDLNVLAKLHEVKGSNEKYTLLHFIVETINNEFPECLNFADELVHVEKAAYLSFSDIKETIENIRVRLKNVQEELDKINVSESSEDKFTEVMSPFALKCHRQIELLAEMMNHMNRSYIRVSKYFAFDVNNTPMEEFFSNIKTFKELFGKAYAEIVGIRGSKHVQNSRPVGRQQKKSPLEWQKKSLSKPEKAKMFFKTKLKNCRVKLERLTEEKIEFETHPQSFGKRKRGPTAF